MKNSKTIATKNGCNAMILKRDRVSGWGNGYVSIPKGHALHGVDYNDLYERDIEIDVHGGLTYSRKSMTNEDLWVFGFDTAHLYDNLINCSEAMVARETISLMEQLIKLDK